MLTGLRNVVGGNAALPFVRLFYGRPSVYLWEDDLGTVHRIPQGEGGEQGDALMPLLFAVLGVFRQHLHGDQSRQSWSRVRHRSGVASPRMHRDPWGKTRVWNRAGGVQCFGENCSNSGPTGVVWEGQISHQQNKGWRYWGRPWDIQISWRVICRALHASNKCCWTAFRWFQMSNPRGFCCLHCASARANFQLRVVRPSAVENFQDPRCRLVAVFVNIVAHRSFSVRINRARSGHVADVLGRSGVAVLTEQRLQHCGPVGQIACQ